MYSDIFGFKTASIILKKEKNANEFMINNKNEKECWASIATLPSQIMSMVALSFRHATLHRISKWLF